MSHVSWLATSTMDFDVFSKLFRERAPVGTMFENPGGGTSTVMSYSEAKVCYMRGKSRIYVNMADLYAAYQQLAGSRVTSTKLRQFAPAVFNSAKGGHNCNATFFFLALRQMGIVNAIAGGGKAGDPFSVLIPIEATMVESRQ